MNEQDRLQAANEFIKVVASCGRCFLSSNSDRRPKLKDPFICFLELDKRGRVWFHDRYTKKRIYTHYRHRWSGFSEGGTLKMIIEFLRDFIKKDKQFYVGYIADYWGYGADISKVKDAALRLGIAY